MICSFRSLSTLLTLATYVSAHGFVTSIKIGGTVYAGPNAQSPPSSSPIREVASGSPVQDVSSNDMICGLSSKLAPDVAKANAGDLLQFYWSGETFIPWFHNTGPIMTYMAKCDGSCSSFTPSSSTKWFKIAEFGEKTPGTPDTWVQADINGGAPVNLTLPSNLPSGDYLLRQEIIALQNAQTKKGAEFYPSCLQLTVNGAGSGTPAPTVSFPGAYSPTDPGILGNMYNPGVIYEFPGGPVSNIAAPQSATDDSISASGGGSPAPASGSSAPANVAATPSSSSLPTPSPSSSSSGSCKRKRAVTVPVKRSAVQAHKKRRLTNHY
ncbi:hypothetical protein SISSUDRAFT_1040403 [Sistotremastrum suecicum HHB10207 ss-3]|uniref:lytic cellulose monooxygenase (C4-dehydrogenating) n=1 Tax=Sistotremastrum suecicum HHB10207 ss-3 TaxID=1314776 RepID=A0A166I4S3_9AGAM|nr:hypothetical protein SISSUDRAFT_1040403 [Sistotremastrum suecicum HHB10207 ss-3]